MSQISVNQFSTLRWSFFEDVIRYAAAGFDSIGIWRSKVEDFGLFDAIDLVHEMKLSVSSLHWAGGFTGSDGRSHKDAIEDAVDAILLAGALNANCLLIHTGARDGHTFGHANRLFNNALDSLLPIAEDFDVRLAIEPMTIGDGQNWTFLNTLEDCTKFLDRFQSDHLGLSLDLYHVGNDEVWLNELSSVIDRLFLVQLADCKRQHGDQQRCSLGEGEINFQPWLKELTRLNYRGPYEVELQGCGMVDTNHRHMLANSKEFLTQTFSDVATELANSKLTQLGIKS